MSGSDGANPKAVIFGCAGPELSDAERDFFAEAGPAGFILFKRNCDSPAQLRRLVASLRTAVGREDAPILIDQEGGRVARLGPPHWPERPPAAVFGALARTDGKGAREAAYLSARLIAHDLAAAGIDVDCAPVADVGRPETHEVIGDRAFAQSPEMVAALALAFCEGLLDGGVQPVVKHIPGHGRAKADSHHTLPHVDAALQDLRREDFVPFRELSYMPWAMTAHIVYSAIDPDRPASVSPRVIGDIIRGEIGFNGVLISDDIAMQALSGTMGERADAVLRAGCDLALHCTGRLDEMTEIAGSVGPLSELACGRLAAASHSTGAGVDDPSSWKERLARLLEKTADE